MCHLCSDCQLLEMNFTFARCLCCVWKHLHQEFNVGFVINRYFRSGAPPVINPLYTRFPRDTVVPGSFAVTLTWILPNRTTGAFNVTSPLPGDWFLAAHLPKDEGKISVKVSLNHLPPTHIFVSCSKANPSVVIYRGPRCCFHTAHVQQTCHSGKKRRWKMC